MTEATLNKLKEKVSSGSEIEENAYGYIINNEFYLKFDVNKKKQNQLQQQLSVYFSKLVSARKDYVERGSPKVKLNIPVY